MAAVSLNQLLSAPQVTRVISRIKTPLSRISTVFGMGPGGSNTNAIGGHFAGYDIFDKTRTIAKGRAPGTGPATIAPQPIGHVSATLYRSHEKMFLLEERIFRTRPLGANWGTVDSRGQSYITKQEEHMAQRFKNSREFMISRLFRGSFQLLNNGDDWIPVDSGGTFTIDYQLTQTSSAVPGLTIGSFSNIIDVAWTDLTANIHRQCMKINAGFEEVHGRPLRHIWCNSTTIEPLFRNVGLINMGGTANTVFNEYGPDGEVGPDGVASTGFTVVFKGIPWVTFHVYDGGLDVNGTYTKFLPDGYAAFHPEVNSDWVEMAEGSEIVAENVTDPGSERFGLAAWTERCTQPAGFELLGVDNCLPLLYIPKCIAYANVS